MPSFRQKPFNNTFIFYIFQRSALIFAPNFRKDMSKLCLKYTSALVFSLFFALFSSLSLAQETTAVQEHAAPKKMDAGEIIIDHVSDAHEYHFLTIPNEANPHESKHITLPLPVILYQEGKGLSVFMSSAFHHGHEAHENYRLITKEYLEHEGLAEMKDAKGQPIYQVGRIYALSAEGKPDANIKVMDFSLTKNATQVMLALILLIYLVLASASKYKKGKGVNSAPAGFQNALESMVTFVRDDVAKPNLGKKSEKYLPFLLTVFFFILINNLFGLIPGSANVSGNIAFTVVLGVISFLVILISTNKHFWGHILNPPVPLGVKPILIPVEILGIFTKPFALIIRLFANMLAGHIIILSFISLIFIMAAMNTALGWGTSPLFVLLAVFIYLLEVLVAFIQAFIFTNLSAVFIGQAFEGGHDEGHH
jgi:F-type H+-transporting ATPase subunit a